MPLRPLDHLPDEIVVTLLDKIAPGSRPTQVELLPGSFSNHTHVVEAGLPDGTTMKCVVRRYQVYGDYDRGEKARREYKAFELMNRRGIPSPEPLLLDDCGTILGSPGIVTRFVQGELRLEAPADPLPWARQMARTLASVHSIPLTETDRAFLLDGNMQASWFLREGAPPQYMQDFPGGAQVWEDTRSLYAGLEPDLPVLLHVDYWPGNLLWQEDRIAAVLDWEEAACGDAGVDVGYARLNLALMGLPQAAEEFLRVYESERGQPVKNLGLWELAAAVRPMLDPAGWELSWNGRMKWFEDFIQAARKRAG